MAKGYWIAQVDVSYPEQYQRYVAAIAHPFARFGARFLVRGGAFERPEGAGRARLVVLESPSYEAALSCYRSPEYQEALKFGLQAAKADLVIVEGYDGLPPA